MIEIFKDTNYDFLGKKKYFITFSLVISLLGFISFFTRGFNMGIDFSGGTVVNVRFKKPPDDSRLRSALAKQRIDASKVIIQPIGSEIGQAPKNEVLIRMPEVLNKDNVDADKRAILEALTNNYSDISQAERQGKADINNTGRDGIKTALMTLDQLGYRQSKGEAGADQEYGRIADSIVDYRDHQRGGIIGEISEIPLGGYPPQLGNALKTTFYTGDFNIVNAEVVGPQVGKELRLRAIYVTLASLGGMLIYIWFRFELIYGIGAIVATFHDVIVTLAFFSLFGWEISLNVIAALLTLIGYSMNDTIVIFDRIRETVRLKRREDITVVSNDAINQTLSRTVITAGMTFLSVVALLVFGGPVLRGFSLTLFIGILIGTYSSIAIATPVMLWWKHIVARRMAASASAAAARNKSPEKPAKAANANKAAASKTKAGDKAKTSNAKA